MLLNIFCVLTGVISICNGARILAVFPAPFYSHQSVFRPLTKELARRGHEVVVITTNPAFKDSPVKNLTEIDVHDVSYGFMKTKYIKVTGQMDDTYEQIGQFFEAFTELMEKQLKSDQLQKFINDKSQRFDLLILEACIRPALVFSHLYKAPVISISSLGSLGMFTKHLGVPSHPILYPTCSHQKLNNLTIWDRAMEVYKHYYVETMLQNIETKENEMLKRNFGQDVPSLSHLKKNIAMLMLNVHHMWEDNRPVPPNVLYLGGLHLAEKSTKKFPTELKSYLDLSANGVIYMSLGSTVDPTTLENVKNLIKALAKLPYYDVLLKWNEEYIPGCPSNVKIMTWTPQRELLHHPNVKLFITQGGLQSTDEAIEAGVPLIGIPVLGDQWYNVEKIVQLKIGLRLDLESVTEEKFLNAIKTVIENKSYKHNIQELREKLYDRPQSALDRAVWWTEYIIRHHDAGKLHLTSPAAHMSSWEYFDMNLILVLASCFLVFLCLGAFICFKLYMLMNKYLTSFKMKEHTF